MEDGTASVGSAGSWTVTQSGSTTGGAIEPGTGSNTLVFDVTNGGNGEQQFTTATAVVKHDPSTGQIIVGANQVTGCYYNWFNTAVSDPDINKNIAAGQSTQITVTVTMPTDTTDNQTACAGASPEVDLNLS